MPTSLMSRAAKILEILAEQGFLVRFCALRSIGVPTWIALNFMKDELPLDFFCQLGFDACVECLLSGWWCDGTEQLHQNLISRMVEVEATHDDWLRIFRVILRRGEVAGNEPRDVLARLFRGYPLLLVVLAKGGTHHPSLPN